MTRDILAPSHDAGTPHARRGYACPNNAPLVRGVSNIRSEVTVGVVVRKSVWCSRNNLVIENASIEVRLTGQVARMVLMAIVSIVKRITDGNYRGRDGDWISRDVVGC